MILALNYAHFPGNHSAIIFNAISQKMCQISFFFISRFVGMLIADERCCNYVVPNMTLEIGLVSWEEQDCGIISGRLRSSGTTADLLKFN